MKRVFRIVFLPIVSIAAIFYLFVLPALVASGTMEISVGNTAFAAFMLFQLWMLIAEFAYESAAAVFHFERKRLFSFLDLHRYEEKGVEKKSGFGVLFLAFLSFLFMVYGFGVIYTFISNITEDAFSSGTLSFIDGVYFSLVTATTVGYGDITPTSGSSRLVVMFQIILSLAYVVMLFSSAVSYVREESQSPNKKKQPDA
ncbi:potassium channel family protein [Pseudomonas benzenivorans]|uniref:Potassium channel domain-containing protein n=1 Tax=Pseudomonas benzenivorans TaxID=556533 RepID=A0ABY5HAB1_9PSED|nr:potassium channel family protein [Pseudomonas benzenivorans]UTW09009.1 hypothetical protein KDW96_06800 [Pseudomonas benzenivorans]